MNIRKNIVDLLSKKTVSNWDKLEVFIGKPCNTLEELLSEIINKTNIVEEKNSSNDNQELIESIQFDLSKERENTKSLKKELSETKESNKTLESELTEKQEKINQLEKQSTQVRNLESLLEQKSQQVNLTLKHWIETQTLIDRTEYDKHLTKEVALQAIMKQAEDALGQLGAVTMNNIGEPFNSKFQTVVTVQETNNPDENNIVCESLSRGYRKDDYCIKEQEVVIYQYKN